VWEGESHTKGANERLREILLILSTFTVFRIFRYHDDVQQWFVRITIPPEVQVAERSSWGFAQYFFTGYIPAQEGFTIEGCQPLRLIPDSKYFDRPNPVAFIVGKDVELELPSSVTSLIDRYYSLSEKVRRSILSAFFLFDQAIELFRTHRSLSFLSAISALETVIDVEYQDTPNEVCPCCNREKYKVGEKFRDFVGRYGGVSPDFRKVSNHLYDLRSRISHGGRLLLGDLEITTFASQYGFSELQDRWTVLQLCRICILNWLLSRTS